MPESKEIATIEETEKALVATAIEDGDDNDLIVPILKLAQGQSGEVQREEAKAGEFVNSLTGDNFGTKIEFVVSGFFKGRFRADPDTNEVITQSNSLHGTCGCHGLDYFECPDSEEQFRAAVNRGDREWGKGPPVSTTYNFVGYVLGSDIPVRLSLMRGQTKAAKKWLTMLRFGRAPWDNLYTVETVGATSKSGHNYKLAQVRQSRKTSAAERQAAVSLASHIQSQRANFVGDEDDPEAVSTPPASNDADTPAY